MVNTPERIGPGGAIAPDSFIPRTRTWNKLAKWAIEGGPPVFNLHGPHLIGKTIFARQWLASKAGALDAYHFDLQGWDDTGVKDVITVACARSPARQLLPNTATATSFDSWTEEVLKVWSGVSPTILALDEADVMCLEGAPQARQWANFLRKLARSSSKVQLLLISREAIAHKLTDGQLSSPRFSSHAFVLPALADCKATFLKQLAGVPSASQYWDATQHIVGNHPYLLDFAIHWVKDLNGTRLDWANFSNDVREEAQSQRVFAELFDYLLRFDASCPVVAVICGIAARVARPQIKLNFKTAEAGVALQTLETLGLIYAKAGDYRLPFTTFGQAALYRFGSSALAQEKPELVDQIKRFTGITNLREFAELAEVLGTIVAAAGAIIL